LKVKAKRAPRPPRVKIHKAVEVVEYASDTPDTPPNPPDFQLSNDNILQHLLNHRMRQRVQREEMYRSFVSQF
jgi:hypothetical protein